jgi:hypothetical protein
MAGTATTIGTESYITITGVTATECRKCRTSEAVGPEWSDRGALVRGSQSPSGKCRKQGQISGPGAGFPPAGVFEYSGDQMRVETPEVPDRWSGVP